MRDLLKTFRHAPLKKKILIIIIFLAIEFSFILAALLAIGNMIKTLKLSLTEADASKSLLYYALNTPTGRPLSYIMIGAIIFLTIWLVVSSNKRNLTDGKDEDGIHYMEQEIYGSARKMTKEEAIDTFNVCHAKDTSAEIYGQFTNNGEEVVSHKPFDNKAEKNRNILIVAPSGSGKSYTQVITDVLQHIKAGHSVFLTDPGGNTYGVLINYIKSLGIKSYCFNLADSRYSNSWNCLGECIDEDTERLSDKRLKDFAQTFMANVGKGKEDYFYNAAINLLMMLIGYTAYEHEKLIISKYMILYDRVTGVHYNDDVTDQFYYRINNEYVSFKWCKKYILEKALEKGYDEEYINNIFEKINVYADNVYPFNIDKLTDNIFDYSTVEANMKDPTQCEIAKWHPAYMAYTAFQQQDKAEVKNAAIQGVQLAFNIFSNRVLKDIISHDEINLKKANLEQTVVFVITSDKSKETKPIASLFFSFMFYDLQDTYDYYKQLSFSTGEPNPCLPTAIFMDDFFSLGLISGDAETFATYMSDARKRELFIIIAIQNYKQFEAIYGEEFTDSIQGNCSTLLCLGANDPNTAQFVSDMCGTATKLMSRHSEIDNALSLAYLNAGVQIQSANAPLIPPGDVLGIDDEVLVKKQGINHILILNPMPWVQLPCYNPESEAWKKTSVYTSIQSYEDKHPWNVMAKGKIDEAFEKVVNTLIANLKFSKKYVIDFETGELIDKELVQDAPKVQENKINEFAEKEHITDKENNNIKKEEGAEQVEIPVEDNLSPINNIDDEIDVDFSQL